MRVTRTIAIGLLWLSATAPICLSALFLGGRLLIRETNWEDPGGSRLESFSLPARDLVWYEKDRELLIGGRMFDVKSIEMKDGVAHITGFFDDLETELNRALEETNGSNRSGSHAGWRLFQSCLGILGVPMHAQEFQAGPPPVERTPLIANPSCRLSDGHRPIDVPPPQEPS